jgi:hypothetical protein
MMNWKGFGRKQLWPNQGTICLEEMRKPTTNLYQDSWRPGQDSNEEPTEYKFRVLPLDQRVW